MAGPISTPNRRVLVRARLFNGPGTECKVARGRHHSRRLINAPQKVAVLLLGSATRLLHPPIGCLGLFAVQSLTLLAKPIVSHPAETKRLRDCATNSTSIVVMVDPQPRRLPKLKYRMKGWHSWHEAFFLYRPSVLGASNEGEFQSLILSANCANNRNLTLSPKV
jgi:hypothetical protein